MTKRPTEPTDDPQVERSGESPGFEAAIEEIESIIDRIESGTIGLEESIRAYERGAGLITRCRSILGKAQRRVEELTLDLQRGGTAGDSPTSADRADDAGASDASSE